MPPRFVYWTIIAGGLPTAFRATEREDLLPTFQRIKEKHPDAEMKWFARGKLWASKEEADRDREERKARFQDRDGGRKPSPFGSAQRTPSGRGAGPRDAGERRDAKWRPGGEHRDPRQKYKDAKQARNLDRRKERFARKHSDGPGADRPASDRPGPPRPRFDKPRYDKPRFEKPRFDRPRSDRPQSAKPAGAAPRFDKLRHDKPRFGDKPRFDKPRAETRRDERPAGEQPPRRDTRPPKKAWDSKPPAGRPAGDWKRRPAGPDPDRERDALDRDRPRPPGDKRRK